MNSVPARADCPPVSSKIVLATAEEHLAGANYLVYWSFDGPQAAETVEEAWRLIGERPFGLPFSVSSPAGLPLDDFITY